MPQGHEMWATLGLEPTQDARAIKRAYALQLKRSRPDGDVDAFQRLRQAYVEALAWADRAWPLDAAGDGGDVYGEGGGRPSPGKAWAASAAALSAAKIRADGADCDACPPAPAPAVPPPPTPTKPATPQDESAAVLQQLLSGGATQRTPDDLSALWQQRRWQAPDAAAVLETALLAALLRALTGPWNEAAQPGSEQRGHWINTVLRAAEHHAWWPVRGGQARQMAAIIALKTWLEQAAVDQVAALDPVGDPDADHAAHVALEAWLQHPVWQQLDNRADALLCWVRYLRDGQWAALGLMDSVVKAFGLAEGATGAHPSAELEALLAAWRHSQPDQWLHRLAAGEEKHAEVAQKVAKVLLQPAIRCEDRKAVRQNKDGETIAWRKQVRLTIAWLDANAPAALGAVDAEVLRWWRQSPLQHNAAWAIAALLGCLMGTLRATHLGDVRGLTGWQLTAPMLVGLAAGGFLGYGAAMALACLRLMWRRHAYPAWRRADLACTRRIPVLGPCLQSCGLWLSRDVLPVLWMIGLDHSALAIGLVYLLWRGALHGLASDD